MRDQLSGVGDSPCVTLRLDGQDVKLYDLEYPLLRRGYVTLSGFDWNHDSEIMYRAIVERNRAERDKRNLLNDLKPIERSLL